MEKQMQVLLSPIQRAVFLRCILAHGFPPSDQLYSRLLQFDRGVFKPSDEEATRRYTEKFISKLEGNEQTECDLFEMKPSIVIIRICQLHKLEKTVNFYKKDPRNFPFIKSLRLFTDSYVMTSINWHPMHDYLLAALICLKGYGKWTEISQARNWTQLAEGDLLDIKLIGSRVFGEWVRGLLQREGKLLPVLKVETILKERAEYLLQLMNTN